MTIERSDVAANRADPGATRPVAARGQYIPGFDGLRAIAVLMVLVAHAGYSGVVPGGLGVTIFFAISGYLITTLLLNELASTGRVNLKLFYARRALRLYPELLAMVALCLLVGPMLGWQATLAEKLAGPLYYYNYYYVYGQHYLIQHSYHWRQLWSLSIEEHFYFIFPGLLLLIGNRPKMQLRVVVALVFVPFIWRFITYYLIGLSWQHNYVATDTRIDSIAWGCLLALLLRDREPGDVSRDRRWLISPAATIFGAILLLSTLVIRNEDFRWTWRFTIQGIALILLIANVLFDPRWRRVVTMLEWRPIRYIGRISYGLYLYHMVVTELIAWMWPTLPVPLLALSAISASVVVASLSYRLLEIPLKGLRRRLGSHVR